MNTLTYLACDHCGAKATVAGCGEGNVQSVSIDLDMPLASKEKHYLGGDLCIDCQTKLFEIIKKFGI